MSRIKKHNKARVVRLPYSAIVTGAPGSGDVVIIVGTLEGNITFNIEDPNAEDGDKLVIMFQADATPRVVTIGGTQGAPGTINLTASGVGAVSLIYSSVAGKYISPVTPS